MNNDSAIYIGGVGMHSAMLDANTACSAARAGIVKSTSLDYLIAEEGEVLPVPLVGFQCLGVNGLTGLTRLAFLLIKAIEDLENNKSLDTYAESKKILTLFCHIPPSNFRPVIEKQELVSQKTATDLFHSIFDRLISKSNIKTQLSLIVFSGEDAEFVETLKAANKELQNGSEDVVLVGSSDSLIEEQTIESYISMRKIHSPSNPAGFIPGEGAAVVKLQNFIDKNTTARISGYNSQSITLSDEQLEQDVTDRSGEAYARSIVNTINKNFGDQNAPANIEVYNNLNGEIDKAVEWGNCYVKVKHSLSNVDDIISHSPAESFGNIGSASAVFALVMAVQSLSYNYYLANSILICASSDSGVRSSILLEHSSN